MKLRLLAILVLLSFGVYWVLQAPYERANPGPVVKGHVKIERDCFKCHTPLWGPSDAKCIACHKMNEEPVKTPSADKRIKVPFHRRLINNECVACHTDHIGEDAPGAVREFDHGLLERSFRADCRQCHVKPADTLHRAIYAECNSCHKDDSWKSVNVDHARYFRFDNDHPSAACVTCHVGGSYGLYTCYGCHQHSETGISKSHAKKKIQYFGNCVGCHRKGE